MPFKGQYFKKETQQVFGFVKSSCTAQLSRTILERNIFRKQKEPKN